MAAGEALAGQVERSLLPRHIAVILDGNGRWAQKRGMPRTFGHKAGAENFRKIATYCRNLGIEYMTVYAFSTENWRRPEDEVGAIMRLLKGYLKEAIETMARDNIRLRFLGDMTPIAPELRELMERTNAISDRLTGFQANICLNYGGQDEIMRAARRFAQDCVAGKAKPEDLTVQGFASYLDTAGLPEPELLIRPGGELRLSNFLLWQCAYAEFYYTDVLWPDFDEEELNRALLAYQQRNRRFGGLKK